MMFKKHIFAIVYGLILFLFTSYVLLDAFVIPRRYRAVKNSDGLASSSQNGTNETDEDSSADKENAVVTDHTYKDENINITLTNYREYDTDIYVADIKLSDVKYLKTAFAQDTYGKNITEKTSQIAENQGAVLAINGDFYSARTGYVLRNGELYRDTAMSEDDALIIDNEGDFSVLAGRTTDIKNIAKQSWQILSFGPALVADSTLLVSLDDEVDKAMVSNPRTAIGQIDTLHYVMVVSDGRTSQSDGLSLFQLGNFMEDLGVKTAYNLDGGGSSTMYFNGVIINKPTTTGNKINERSVSDIVYIG